MSEKPWIPHDGGPCPVDKWVVVDLKFAELGSEHAVVAGDWYWGRDPQKTGGPAGEIVAYREHDE